jgi:hypothetical protein
MREALEFPRAYDWTWMDEPDDLKWAQKAIHQSSWIANELTYSRHRQFSLQEQYYTFFSNLRKDRKKAAIKKMAHDAIRLPWVKRK